MGGGSLIFFEINTKSKTKKIDDSLPILPKPMARQAMLALVHILTVLPGEADLGWSRAQPLYKISSGQTYVLQ